MATAAAPRSALFAILLGALWAAAAASAVERAPPRATSRVWYVDNTAPDGGDGSLVAPFRSLERAERASDVGDTLYVFRGDGTSQGLDVGIRLKPHQRLLGSGSPLSVPGEEPLPAGDPPLLAAAGGAVVELAERASVAGVAIAGDGAEAGIRARGVRAVSVDGVRIDGAGTLGIGLELRDVQGAAVSSIAVAGAREHGVLLERSGGVAIHTSRIEHGGEAGAALAVREPAGQVEISVMDVHLAAGTALSIDAGAGTGTVVVRRASVGARPQGAPGATGIEVLVSGSAALGVEVDRAVLSGGSRGIVARAGGGSRLELRIAGSGVLMERHGAEAVALHASERAEVRLEVVGNDLPASDLGLFVTATGEARLEAEVTDNAIPRVPRGRGIAVVLGDRAEGSVHLLRNRLAGHRAEALYVLAGADSRLALELRDNSLAAPAPASTPPYPTVLLQAREQGRLCLTVAANHIATDPAGSPSLAIRQRGSGGVSVSGLDLAAVEAPLEQRLAKSHGLGRIELSLERPLAPAGDLLCPQGTPQVAAGG